MARLLLLLALALSGCSLVGPSDADIEAARAPEAEGVVVNRTGSSFIPMAVDAELAAVISIAGEFEVTDPSVVVRPGAAAPLPVGGYREGEDFLVFVFRVRGSRASYAGSVPVSAAEFERADAVVTVRRY